MHGIWRQLGILILAFPALLSCASRVEALSRDEVIFLAIDYVQVTYTVTADNLYPTADVPCYTGTTGMHHREGIVAGSVTGEVYCFGYWRTWWEMGNDITAGKGAGAYADLWYSDETCVKQYCTGIDCSKFVARCWGYEADVTDEIWNIGSGTMLAEDSSYPLDSGKPPLAIILRNDNGDVDFAKLQSGDAIAKTGNPGHARLFGAWVDPETKTSCGMFEATGFQGNDRCIARTISVTTLISEGFTPVVSTRVLNDSATSLLFLKATRTEAGAVKVAWKTLPERDTRSFLLFGATNVEGPYEPLCGEIMAGGDPTKGADYEIVVHPTEGSKVVRIMEVEETGRTIWRSIEGIADASKE